jgi:hypothetical protein
MFHHIGHFTYTKNFCVYFLIQQTEIYTHKPSLHIVIVPTA